MVISFWFTDFNLRVQSWKDESGQSNWSWGSQEFPEMSRNENTGCAEACSISVQASGREEVCIATRLWAVWGPPVYLVSSLKQWTQKRWPHWAWTGFLSTWRHCWHLYLFSMGTDNTLRGIPGKDEEQSSEIRAILPHQSVVNSWEGKINVNNQQGSLFFCHPLFCG